MIDFIDLLIDVAWFRPNLNERQKRPFPLQSVMDIYALYPGVVACLVLCFMIDHFIHGSVAIPDAFALLITILSSSFTFDATFPCFFTFYATL